MLEFFSGETTSVLILLCNNNNVSACGNDLYMTGDKVFFLISGTHIEDELTRFPSVVVCNVGFKLFDYHSNIMLQLYEWI